MSAAKNRCSATFLFTLFTLCFAAAPAIGAIGCELDAPDRDVARMVSGSTGYRTALIAIDGQKSRPLRWRVEERLGDWIDESYEAIEFPYTIYEIYRGNKKMGYITGVNEKGAFGDFRVFVALDMDGRILSCRILNLKGEQAKMLMEHSFGRQFAGISLLDFDSYDPMVGSAKGRTAEIRNPSPDAEADFRAVMRATKKSLVLMDLFVFSNERVGR